MKDSYGQHGWREFYTNRKNILQEFDRIRELTTNRPVQTAHGVGVEAYIRSWLSDFLPKKYGVTSGYIIPDLYGAELKLYHADVIIYDVLNAPILWTEGNADDSSQGKYRAIPAKHVIGLYEVKSRFIKANVVDALAKLNETAGFREQLHPRYSCGVIFIELMERENKNDAILKELIKGKDVFGFRGGVVLRYEGDDTSTGLISFLVDDSNTPNGGKQDDDPMKGLPLAKPMDKVDVYLREDGSLELGEVGASAELVCVTTGRWEVSKSYGLMFSEGPLSVHLSWSRGNFSKFCIDLLSTLEGLRLKDSNRPSFGTIFDHIETRKAPAQGQDIVAGLPFIVASLHAGGPKGEKMLIEFQDETATVELWMRLENKGDTAAEVSDDGFKTRIALPVGAKATKSMKMVLGAKEGTRIQDIFKGEAPLIRYRVIYYPTPGDKALFGVEGTIKVDRSDPRML